MALMIASASRDGNQFAWNQLVDERTQVKSIEQELQDHK